MTPFTLTPDVRADLAVARLWYDQQRGGLGDDFATEFYAALERIREAPTAQTWFSSRYRKRRVAGFPYSVYFHASETELTIVALIHRRRFTELVLQQLSRPDQIAKF